MNEHDYIIATDLARMQILGDILRMVNDDGASGWHPVEAAKLAEFRAHVARWREALEKLAQDPD